MALPTYSHSGRMGVLSLLLGPAAGLAAGVALAVIYQYAVYYIPFIYINFLLTLAFGAGIGFACGYALKFGKCRNAAIAMLIGVACGTAAIVTSHIINYRIVLSEVQEELRKDGMTPAEVEAALDFGKFIDLRVDNGWTLGKSKSGTEISGAFVWIIWLIELGAVAGMAAVLARVPIDHPFCEQCDCWADSEYVGSLTPAAYSALTTAIARDDMAAIVTPQREPRSDKTAKYTLYRCPSCRKNTHLSCKVTYKVMEKGKATEKSESAFEYVAVDDGQIETLKQTLAGPPPEPLPQMAPAQKMPAAKLPAPARKPLPGRPPVPRPPAA